MRWTIGTGLVLILAQALSAQPPGRVHAAFGDSSTAAIAKSLRSDNTAWSVINDRVLRLQDARFGIARRDALLDTLVAIALGTGVEVNPENTARAAMAISRLEMAGAVGKATGTPWEPALQTLIRVHRETRMMGARGAMLHWLTGMSRPDDAIAYLREVAMSPTDPTAYDAIVALEREMRTGGSVEHGPTERRLAEAVLRELYEKKLVTQPALKSLLADIALANHWGGE